MERISDFINNGEMDAEMIHVESEHSALSAGSGACAAGARVFTASASQGLALMHEILHMVSGLRQPIVMAVANRALSAPINIWNDHQDSMNQRDTSWIQLYVETSQEAMDTVIQAYKIAENKDVQLPVMVCLDGFTLSHVYEPTTTPSQEEVDQFLPKYEPFVTLDPKKPVTIGPIAYPNTFMELKKQQQDAMDKSIEIIKEVNRDFGYEFSRKYGDGLIEGYKTEDAESVLVCMGSVCGTIRVIVDEYRKKGQKVGLLKIKSFRPFPKKEINEILKDVKNVGIIDRNVSYGNAGSVFIDMRDALYETNKNIKGFIAGLGGRDVTKQMIRKAFDDTMNYKEETEWLL